MMYKLNFGRCSWSTMGCRAQLLGWSDLMHVRDCTPVYGIHIIFYHVKDYWSLLQTLRNLPNPLVGMQYKLHTALSKSFRARNFPIYTLPQYRQMPRNAVQQDASWSCGTIAICTTLHLLLGDRHPHELHGLHITKTDMLTLHRELLEWSIAGTPLSLWQIGCLNQGIQPTLAHRGSYSLLSVTSTTSLTKGQPWRP